jgi:hypothetical protein
VPVAAVEGRGFIAVGRRDSTPTELFARIRLWRRPQRCHLAASSSSRILSDAALVPDPETLAGDLYAELAALEA